MSSSNAKQPPCSVVRAYHILNIDGYSRTLGLGTQQSGAPRYLESCPFRAGERTWSISYYPLGTGRENADFIAVFLALVDTDDGGGGGEDDVIAQVTFSLLGQGEKKTLPSYSRTTPMLNLLTQLGGSAGYDDFITRKDLEQSGLLLDDCFAIRVDLHIVKQQVVRPSDMHLHLGDLLSSNRGADVEFHVSGKTFAAHRLVLRARSPVFKAQLLLPPVINGAATTADVIVVEIDDMEPRVFEALLNFIYTDAWPMMMEHGDDDEEFAMAKGLLAAANRYGLKRLKLTSENWLCNQVDAASVSTVLGLLALSERHTCPVLKGACFDFISYSTVRSAIKETDGFDCLAQSYPDVAKELIDNIIDRDNE